MKHRYYIQSVYPNIPGMEEHSEIEIISQGLVYAEIGVVQSGCQCASPKNQEQIHKLCKQISILIKEVEKLNK